MPHPTLSKGEDLKKHPLNSLSFGEGRGEATNVFNKLFLYMINIVQPPFKQYFYSICHQRRH